MSAALARMSSVPYTDENRVLARFLTGCGAWAKCTTREGKNGRYWFCHGMWCAMLYTWGSDDPRLQAMESMLELLNCTNGPTPLQLAVMSEWTETYG